MFYFSLIIEIEKRLMSKIIINRIHKEIDKYWDYYEWYRTAYECPSTHYAERYESLGIYNGSKSEDKDTLDEIKEIANKFPEATFKVHIVSDEKDEDELEYEFRAGNVRYRKMQQNWGPWSDETEQTKEEIIYRAVCDFVSESYGETPDDACYDLISLAETISKALSA